MKGRHLERATDWDAYYQHPHRINIRTRRITERKIIALMQKNLQSPKCEILEIGGGGSCFFESVRRNLPLSAYAILDNNLIGAELFMERYGRASQDLDVEAYVEDARIFISERKYDIVYSVGLIEHFGEMDRHRIIETHFQCTKPGGIVLILFPTPTASYRMIRKVMQWGHVWAFHDETPLNAQDVKPSLELFGTILEGGVIHIPLTQRYFVCKKGK